MLGEREFLTPLRAQSKIVPTIRTEPIEGAERESDACLPGRSRYSQSQPV